MHVRTENDLKVQRLWIDTNTSKRYEKAPAYEPGAFAFRLSGKRMGDIIWYVDIRSTLLFFRDSI